METPLPPVILIVDDVQENRKLLASLIRTHFKCRIMLAKSGDDALKAFQNPETPVPTLILLDVMMPGMNGFEAAAQIRAFPGAGDIPILFITAMDDTRDKLRAFEAGGVDFISKPFNPQELVARVDVHLKLKVLTDQLREKNRLLEDREAHLQTLVDHKTRQLENMNICMVTALENANFYNDSDTGQHIRRVALYSELLADRAGIGRDMVRKIKLYAPLHDVGKVGIPDGILKKPGKYTDAEFEQMKQHVAIGGKMLDGEGFDRVARNIALYHHEKWAGNGYLQGLAREEIPIEARIVSLADVYDALTTVRSYKPAFSEEETAAIMKQEAGNHFDPGLVAVFEANQDGFIAIRRQHRE